MSLSAIPKSLRKQIFERDDGRCRYCGLTQVGQGAIFHINHIVPRSAGGPTEAANLALQCPHCSLHKADKVVGIDPVSGQAVRLYHPLEHRWEEHFSLKVDETCIGITPIGRATAEALAINANLPLIARALQLRVGLIRPTAS